MLIVQKYGGATLSDATKVRAVAEKIAAEVSRGHQIVAVVSAMGSTTNELIALAHQVSPRPTLREMDMLLTTGERISMSLVSMALNNLGIRATSLTGSQAGILTNESHANAFIQDVKAFRVQEALKKGHVVVLAGFQGVCPESKEITTLGRGGTDTTAIAMAAFLKADHCEILKEVPAVFSADPRAVTGVKPIRELDYEEMAEMTFWGAKVLHYRSVELALRHRVPVYVGPAHEDGEGTWIRAKGKQMYEKTRILSLNSYEKVLRLRTDRLSFSDTFSDLEKKWESAQVPLPQFLSVEHNGSGIEVWVTGPSEILAAIEKWVPSQNIWELASGAWSSVTATCAGTTSAELTQRMTANLTKSGVKPISCRWSALSVSFLIPAEQRQAALQTLHTLVE
jgi:aspartate kinase